MASTKLLVACIMLGLCALAFAQLKPDMDAEIQKHYGHKKDTHKQKTYKKDDYEEKEYKDDPEDTYFTHKDYHKSPPPSPSPPPPPVPSPKYAYDDKYDDKPSGHKPYNGYKNYERYEYPKTQYPGGPSHDFKPYPSPPPPVVQPPKYYPDNEYSDSYGSGGYHPKDISFTLKESLAAMSPAESPGVGTITYRSAMLIGEVDGAPMTVGSLGWTGIVYSSDPVINWQLSFAIDQEDWEGKIIAAGPAGAQSAMMHPKEWPVLGGSGMFEGATGKVTWIPAVGAGTALYKFEITLWPHKKRHHSSYASIASLPTGLPRGSSSRR